eukprot:TRINITY_DN3248_c0_g1_i1.p1 TRINITY_DN3248_c0_g1~~TRINITY_DN3248_c0_g1_i1.p1  ORF type:complete len:293 (+),score=110.09 TRINITY_DN3248_c0_g1_i1:68-946(+)
MACCGKGLDCCPVDNIDETLKVFPKKIRARLRAIMEIEAEIEKLQDEKLNAGRLVGFNTWEKSQPLIKERADIISGKVEPEVPPCPDSDDDEKDEKLPCSTEETKGVPHFWMTTLQNTPISKMIGTNDYEALEHLSDVRSVLTKDEPCTRIEFEFTENKFFSDKTLWVQVKTKPNGQFISMSASPVTWTKADLKDDEGNSFFNIFDTPVEKEDMNEEEREAILDAIEDIFQVVVVISETLVMKAVEVFTGDCEEFNEDSDSEPETDEDGSDPDLGPEEDLEGEEEKPECKQQ